jgi:hypothetical protein
MRWTEEEHAHVLQQARTAGKNIQSFLRALAAGSKLKAVQKYPDEVYASIVGIGRNLNQLTKKANSGAPVPKEALDQLAEECRRMIQRLL